MSDHDPIPCDYAREAWREGNQVIRHDDPEPVPAFKPCISAGLLRTNGVLILCAIVGGVISWLVFAP